MKKELKDYLHLYLGCRGTANILYKHETLNCLIPIPNAILCSVSNNGLIKVQCHDINGEGWSELVEIKAEDFKPILRKINDLNEYEQHEAIIMEELIGGLGQPQYEAESIRWWLSKHFDLFGLIESGLAIDKTTLNKVTKVQVSDTTMLNSSTKAK